MKIAVQLNKNRVVTGYHKIISSYKYEGEEVETDLDIDNVDIVNNYKYENSQLIELSEEEKQIDTCPTTKPSLDDLIFAANSNRERLDVLESVILDLIIE